MKTFLMNLDILITITLFLLVLVSTFMATNGMLMDNRFKGFFERLTKNGWRLIVVNIIILIVLIGQYYHNKYIAKIKDQEYQIKQDTRYSILKVRYDSSLLVMKSKFDESNIKTITTVTEVLGGYGYKLDSANRRLVKILKDSAKTKVILPNDPVLLCSAIQLYEQTRGNSVYRIEICSNDAGSTGFDIKGNFLAVDSLNHKIYLGGKTIFDYEDRIPKDSINGFYIGINDSLYSYVLIRLLGSYKNIDGSKSFPIDDVITYNIKARTFHDVTGPKRKEIIDLLKDYTKQSNVINDSTINNK